ncbi:MAG TPA: CGNR zinc finger domain-containing protein [Gemmatimonadaceae bacterium]|nr:CGNR zinc finger domain-containing protein [Gemmatimonadaceae bacterium]
MQLVHHQFDARDFVAGHIALDLANTVAGRDPDRARRARGDTPGRDRLPDYDAVLAWSAAMAGAAVTPILAPDEARGLARMAGRAPARAATALEALKRFREALFAAAVPLARAADPPATALDVLRGAWLEAAAAARLTRTTRGLAPRLTTAASGLDLPRHRAAWAAMELLTTGDLTRLRLCAGDDCAWLFLDGSKARRRRWCDMATCGNVAKARRHYERRRRG